MPAKPTTFILDNVETKFVSETIQRSLPDCNALKTNALTRWPANLTGLQLSLCHSGFRRGWKRRYVRFGVWQALRGRAL
jgi:hypothetical protein